MASATASPSAALLSRPSAAATPRPNSAAHRNEEAGKVGYAKKNSDFSIPSYSGLLRNHGAVYAKTAERRAFVRASRLQANARLGGFFSKPQRDEEEEEVEEKPARKSPISLFSPRSGTQKNVKPVSDEGLEAETGSGTTKLRGTLKLIFGGSEKTSDAKKLPKDDTLVFVAGANGNVGSRTVRELISNGFKVRAGVRNIEKAKEQFSEFIESDKPAPFWSNLPFFGSKKEKVFQLVEVDLEDTDTIEDAISNSGKVICTIGASENEALSFSAPYRIDGQATKNLIRAATSLNVNQFVLVTSLGTGKIGFPAAILNLFWGVLIWKAQAEKELKDSGLAFTIIRPGGMERPKDDYKLTHNLKLYPADSIFGGQVSNLQVAELIVDVVKNPEVSENKILEAIAETTAPLRDTVELIAEIPVTGLTQSQRQELLRKKAEEEEAQRQIELEKARIKAEEERIAEEKRLEEEREREERRRAEEKARKLKEVLSEKLYEAVEKKNEAEQLAEASAQEKLELEKKLAEIRQKAFEASLAALEAKKLEEAVLDAAKQGKLLSAEEKEKIVAQVRETAIKKNAEATEESKSSKSSLLLPIQLPWGKKTEDVSPKEEVEEEKEEKPIVKQEEKPRVVKEEEKPKVVKEEKPVVAKREIKPIKPLITTVEELEGVGVDISAARAAAQDRVRRKLGLDSGDFKAKEDQKKKEEEKKREEEEQKEKERIKALEEEKIKEEEERKRKEEEEKEKEAIRALEEEKKKEEEERLKAEEEERIRIENELKEKELAELKAREEEEEKKKKEEEERKKKEEEERVLAELKAKEEEEKKKKEEEERVLAELKAKEEEEKKKKEEEERVLAELKAKEEEEKKKKEEEEKKKKEEEEKALIEAKKKEEEEKRKKEEESRKQREKAARIEELRSKIANVSLPQSKPLIESKVEVLGETLWTEEAINSTLQKKKGLKIRWPWAKPEEETVEEEEIVSQADSAVIPEAASSVPVAEPEVVVPPPPVEQVPEEKAPKVSSTDLPPSPTPLSPYTAYPDLKPPASPTPSPPVVELKAETPKPKKSTDFPPSPTPLSPYTMYPDLKPPTSPIPKPPTP